MNRREWKREETSAFFSDYEDPFFQITAPIEVGRLREFCSANDRSFFFHYLHAALSTAQEIPEFRYRFSPDKEEVRVYDTLGIGSTVLKDDKTFGFCYFDFEEDVLSFTKKGQQKIEEFKEAKHFEARAERLNLLHCSVIPWISFTGFKHARKKIDSDCVPKLVFGKCYEQGSKYLMPLSVEVNHCMMDGFHVGLYFEKLQKQLNSYI